VVLTNLSYWLILFVKLLFLHNNYKETSSEYSVSLVVCIKNGLRHLSNINSYLKTLRNSDQLVIVDDFSTDGTLGNLKHINDEKMRVVSASIDQKGKKMALKEGIESSNCELILLTDIDCQPRAETWRENITMAFDEKIDLVLGYGAYKKIPGMLNAFIRHETLMTAIQYMSYAKAGMPYMGVGRNMAYKKQLFLASDRFESHKDIASGDDDLFVSSVANGHNTAVSMHPDSFTESVPAKTFSEFSQQKARHVSTASRYKLLVKILLFIYAASHILSYVLPILLFFLGFYTFAIGAFLSRLLVSWLIYYKLATKFEEEDLGLLYPFLDLLMILYYLILSPSLVIRRKQW